MLKRLVQVTSSRWTKGIVLALWLLSLLHMIDRGWTWESWEAVPSRVEHRTDYFDIHRSALFVWLTLILFGYFAYHFKQHSLGYYGIVEVVVGIIGGFIAIENLSLDTAPAWLALAASAYVIVRGAGNVSEAVKKRGES